MSNQLDPIYGCVQGGHAVAQWLLENPDQTWNNNYLIYLSADIEKWLFQLNCKQLRYSVFKEPDLGNTPTAIAIESDGMLFRNLRLMGE